MGCGQGKMLNALITLSSLVYVCLGWSEMWGVACAKVRPGQEDSEEGPPWNGVPQDPPPSVHPQQLRDGQRRRSVQGRRQSPDPERPWGGVRSPAGGELLRRGRPGPKVSLAHTHTHFALRSVGWARSSNRPLLQFIIIGGEYFRHHRKMFEWSRLTFFFFGWAGDKKRDRWLVFLSWNIVVLLLCRRLRKKQIMS